MIQWAHCIYEGRGRKAARCGLTAWAGGLRPYGGKGSGAFTDKPLWGLRVLKFDGAIAPRVLKFDSGFAAEGCGGRLTFIEGALL